MDLPKAKAFLRSEYWLVLLIWGVYATTELLLFPAFAPVSWSININGQSVFVLLYQAVIALLIAFPVADALLSQQRYIAFAGVTLGVLAASSLLLEFFLDPLLFGSRIIPAATYITILEAAGVTLLLTAVRLLLNRYQTEQRLAILQRANAEAELENLRGQINPHFLFNALNNIYSHALHHSDKTPNLILKLSDMLRYTTYDCSDETVPIEKEIAFLSDYLEIQKMALNGRGMASFNVNGDATGKRISPFLLIPFVENCFKHSLDTMDNGIDIQIMLEFVDGRVRLSCSNTFCPATEIERKNKSNGLGEANVLRRLQLLFNDDFTFHKSVDCDRYRITLELPIQS
ncbi:MAG: histidine kinase [Pseudomonadota bacterium]